MLPVLKKADWSSTKKKRATRASWSVRGRNGRGSRASVSVFAADPLVTALAFAAEILDDENSWTACSRRTQLTKIAEKTK